jgi:hypothetical protein
MSDFNVPEGYFENSKKSILTSIGATESSNEFDVPSGYFEKSSANILEKTKSAKVVSIFPWRKLVLFAGSAAAIAVLALQFIGQEKEVVQPSFADLLEQVDLNEETVFEDATLDELLQFYSSEINAIVEDTTQKSVDSKTLDYQPTQMQKNTHQEKKVKPNTKNEHPTINELSEEEILKYLIEEGGDSYEIK